MTVFVHSIVIICFKFLFVDRLGPIETLTTRNLRMIGQGKDHIINSDLNEIMMHGGEGDTPIL